MKGCIKKLLTVSLLIVILSTFQTTLALEYGLVEVRGNLASLSFDKAIQEERTLTFYENLGGRDSVTERKVTVIIVEPGSTASVVNLQDGNRDDNAFVNATLYIETGKGYDRNEYTMIGDSLSRTVRSGKRLPSGNVDVWFDDSTDFSGYLYEVMTTYIDSRVSQSESVFILYGESGSLEEPSMVSPNPDRQEDGVWLLRKVSDYDGRFLDTKGVWCEDAAAVMYETGLMLGRTDGTFGPSATLTIPHILAITARLHANLTDSDIDAVAASWLSENGPIQWPGTWYESYYAYLCSVLKVSNLGDFNPNANCSRGSYAELLSAVLEVAEVELPTINAIPASLPDVSEDYAESSFLWQAVNAGTIKKSRYDAILSFYRTGVLTGFDKYGTFRSGSTLNRGQAAAMLARMVDPALREHYTTLRFDLCKDVLGLEHDAPAATINGVDITANQFSYAFAVGRTVENAIDFLAEQSVAVDLAVKEGYTPTDDEIAALREKASERDGFAGLDADAWFYELSQTAAVEYVYKVFIERYGDDSNSRYTDGGNSYLTASIYNEPWISDRKAVASKLTGWYDTPRKESAK